MLVTINLKLPFNKKSRFYYFDERGYNFREMIRRLPISRIVTVSKIERNLHFTLKDSGRGSSGKSNNDVKKNKKLTTIKKTSPAKKVDLQKPLHDRIWTSNEVPAGMIRCDLIPEEIIKNGKSKNLEDAQTLVENRSKILVRIIPIVSCSIPYVIGLMAAGVSYFLGNASAALLISNIGCFMMIPGYFIGIRVVNLRAGPSSPEISGENSPAQYYFYPCF